MAKPLIRTVSAEFSEDKNSRPGAGSGFAEGGRFATTHWSIVLSAGRSQSIHAQQSLEQLCRVYWYPIYTFIRRQSYGPDDAKDLTQGYFACLIGKKYLQDVDRSKGRFRSFLLTSLKHFLSNERDRERALKRGGGHVHIPLDLQSAEDRFSQEPAAPGSADKSYERQWALTVLAEVVKQLRDEYTADGKVALFGELKGLLTGDRSGETYVEIGKRLGMTEGAVKVAVHRLRQRYRTILKAIISDTVASPGEVDAELKHLFAALGGE